MGTEFVDQLKSFQLGSLNALEWCGIVAIGLAILIAGNKAPRFGNARKTGKRVVKRSQNKEKPRSVPKGRDKTVLVVDDDASMLRAHSRLIGRMGYSSWRTGSDRLLAEQPCGLNRTGSFHAGFGRHRNISKHQGHQPAPAGNRSLRIRWTRHGQFHQDVGRKYVSRKTDGSRNSCPGDPRRN